jgi:hypothetical protein
MSRPDYIPQTDADFLVWAKAFIDNLGKNLERFGFPAALYARLVQLLDDFVQQYQRATDPVTRTGVAVRMKNEARNTLKKSIRQAVKEHLACNSALTGHDRTGLGLPVYKTTRARAAVADNWPECAIDCGLIRHIIIHFLCPERRSKAKPPGQFGAVICWVISDTPPVSLTDLIHSSFNTRTPITLEFHEQERGKTLYFALCWINTRGEKGPWSGIHSTVIP